MTKLAKVIRCHTSLQCVHIANVLETVQEREILISYKETMTGNHIAI